MPTGGLSSVGTSIYDWAKGKFNDWNPKYPGGSW
jgi:hypothetical protein